MGLGNESSYDCDFEGLRSFWHLQIFCSVGRIIGIDFVAESMKLLEVILRVGDQVGH